jgi:hypothetical protein
MEAATSTIQIATLAVAALAVAASVIGTIISSRAARRTEHDIWQRDLQERLYSECISAADQIHVMLGETVFERSRPRAEVVDPELAQEKNMVKGGLLGDLLQSLRRSCSDINTFGRDPARDSAWDLLHKTNEAVLHLLQSHYEDSSGSSYQRATSVDDSWKEPGQYVEEANGALSDFREAVRSALNISN